MWMIPPQGYARLKDLSQKPQQSQPSPIDIFAACPTYIQITTSDDSEPVRQVCLELAENITAGLEDIGQEVWGLIALPERDLVPQSVQFFLVDALGYSFLHNAYTAKYHTEMGELFVFLSEQDNPESADLVVSRIGEHVNKYGKGIEFRTMDGIDLVSCNMGRYSDVIFRKGTMVGGVTDVQDEKTALKAASDFYKQIEPE